MGRLLLCILLPFLVLLSRGALERVGQAAFRQFRCTLFQGLNVLGVGGIDDDDVAFFVRLVTLHRKLIIIIRENVRVLTVMQLLPPTSLTAVSEKAWPQGTI